MKYVVSIAGIYYAEVPPVPIPNTEVKLSCADNTWRVTAWKDRSLPAQKTSLTARSFFLYAVSKAMGIC